VAGSLGGVRIARSLLDEIVAHAREETPNECCGMVAGRDGRATRVHRARNAFASPLRYEVDPQDQYRITMEIEERGEEIAAIYHSHTRSEAYPSQTDINLAANWPDPLYLICSLVNPDEPDVRAFAIRDDAVEETALDVEDG
jgi:[CysO sulfur-carrier protein]-S-L-cysteine hydrolase